MVDRGVVDGVPDITESWDLKHETPRTSTIHTLCIRNQHVLQGSNKEMVDRGVFDGVPYITESWNLKHETSRTSNISTICIRNQHVIQGSNQEMVDRGVFDGVPEVTENWNLKHETSINYPCSIHQEPTCPPRIQPGDGTGWDCLLWFFLWLVSIF